MKVPRTQQEKEEKYLQQLFFLQSSCYDFDQGAYFEAVRMSASIFMLLHSHRNQISLLEQTGRKGILFKNTCMPLNSTRIATSTESLLVCPDMGRGTYMPIYNDNTNFTMMEFDDWWNMDVLYSVDHQVRLSRKDLIRTMRDQDGGGHVDPELESKYAEFTIREGPTLQIGKPGKNIDIDKPFNPDDWMNVSQKASASVRQIAHEVLDSLEQQIEIQDNRLFVLPFTVSIRSS